MKKVILTVLALIVFSGFQSGEVNNPADGNVTGEEVNMMQQAWCDYNEGRDFAKEQCE